MKKINYRLVFNRKKHLNAQGKALLQVEASLEKKKIYFSTHIYLTPEQWDNKKKVIKKHPHARELNYMLLDFIIHLEQKGTVGTSEHLHHSNLQCSNGNNYNKGLEELSVECWYINFSTFERNLHHNM